MNNDKETSKPSENDSDKQQKDQSLHVKNPFEPGGDKEISQEQVDKEQEYKEALTERD